VRPAVWFLVGLLPGTAAVVAFKTALAPPTYQFAGREVSQLLAQLADASRYAAIASAVRGAALRATGLVLLALVIYIALLGRTRDQAARRAAAAAALVTALLACGDVGAYLTTPADLVWQLGHSLDRVLLQLWPSALFAFWLYAASPAEVGEPAPGGRPSRRRAASASARGWRARGRRRLDGRTALPNDRSRCRSERHGTKDPVHHHRPAARRRARLQRRRDRAHAGGRRLGARCVGDFRHHSRPLRLRSAHGP
jgi:hypothetical protein